MNVELKKTLDLALKCIAIAEFLIALILGSSSASLFSRCLPCAKWRAFFAKMGANLCWSEAGKTSRERPRRDWVLPGPARLSP